MFKEYGKSIIYGGLDGIITTFAVVSGSIGGNLSSKVVLILGISNLIADGFSMAAGDYLSSLTEDNIDKKSALLNGVTTFISFNIFGSIPLLAYFLSTSTNIIVISSYISFALIVLGYVKSLITQRNKFTEITQTLAVGIIASLVAYLLGVFLSTL